MSQSHEIFMFRDNRDVSVWIIEMPKSALMFVSSPQYVV